MIDGYSEKVQVGSTHPALTWYCGSQHMTEYVYSKLRTCVFRWEAMWSTWQDLQSPRSKPLYMF